MLRPLRHTLSFVQCRCELGSDGASIKSELEPCSQGLILSVQTSLKHPSPLGIANFQPPTNEYVCDEKDWFYETLHKLCLAILTKALHDIGIWH